MTYAANQTAETWISGCEQWMNDYRSEGYKPYFLEVMFHPLPGGKEQILDQMRGAIENHMYSKLCTYFAKRPRAESQQHLLPKVILFDDVPVWKHAKTSLRQFYANDGGHHFQGFCLISPHYWMKKGCPIDLVEQLQPLLARKGIARVHLSEIEDEAGMTDYALKHMKWNADAERHVIVLPRSARDMKRNPPMAPEEKAMKDIQSAYNLSDEAAIAMLENRNKSDRSS